MYALRGFLITIGRALRAVRIGPLAGVLWHTFSCVQNAEIFHVESDSGCLPVADRRAFPAPFSARHRELFSYAC